MENLNIVAKMTKARQELAEQNLRKSGKNQHIGFAYYELSDFLPSILALEAKYEMVSTIEMTSDMATLTIKDISDYHLDRGLRFSVPFVMAEFEKSQPTQNLGATVTYIKRYLYMLAYAIEEQDVMDATIGEEVKPQFATERQLAAINKMHINIDTLLKEYNLNTINELTMAQANEQIKKRLENLQR